MNNKFVWLAAGIVLTYFYMKSKNKKEIMQKVDKAVETVQNEMHANFNQAIDAAAAKGYGLKEFKIVVNS